MGSGNAIRVATARTDSGDCAVADERGDPPIEAQPAHDAQTDVVDQEGGEPSSSGTAARGGGFRRAWRQWFSRLAEGIPPSPFEIAVAALLGGMVVAVGNGVAIALTVPWPQGGLAIRAAHHGFDLLQVLGLSASWGLVAALLAQVTRRWWSVSWLLIALVAMGGMWFALGLHLERQADCVLGGRFAWLLHPTYVVLCGLAVVAAHLVGGACSRTAATVGVGVGLGLAGNVLAHAILRDDYPGVHAAILWVSIAVLGSTLAPRMALAVRSQQHRLGVVAAMAVAVTAAILWTPSNVIRLELFREPGAVGAWVLARTVWARPPLSATAQADVPVYQPPSHPEVPPLGPDFAERPVVVLVSVEALRADVLASSRYDAQLPNLVALRNEGAYFPHAVGPGSQTSVVLTSVFTGRYFSQLRWAKHGKGTMRFLYAAEDEAVRFPELLGEAGVATESFLGLIFLGEHFGITRGFGRETMVVQDRRHAMAVELVRPLLKRLRQVRKEPFFAYTHLMEPHAPYDRGRLKEGSEWDRYVSEIAEADRWIGQLVRELRRRFRRRGYLILMGDHGEAFGEHGTHHHSKTLYDELVRIPLIVWGPGIPAQVPGEPAGLIDVGPTILHLFRLPPQPGHMGQSLLPLIEGKVRRLDRPLLAEGRLRRALFQRDGIKVIEDTRRKTVEVYDLPSDPGEARNLFDHPTLRVERAVARLRAFFDRYTLTADGYRPPFKR